MAYSPEQIIKAKNFAALVVAKYGEVYLPIFEQMEREVANLDKKEGALARARQLAEHQLAA